MTPFICPSKQNQRSKTVAHTDFEVVALMPDLQHGIAMIRPDKAGATSCMDDASLALVF